MSSIKKKTTTKYKTIKKKWVGETTALCAGCGFLTGCRPPVLEGDTPPGTPPPPANHNLCKVCIYGEQTWRASTPKYFLSNSYRRQSMGILRVSTTKYSGHSRGVTTEVFCIPLQTLIALAT